MAHKIGRVIETAELRDTCLRVAIRRSRNPVLPDSECQLSPAHNCRTARSIIKLSSFSRRRSRDSRALRFIVYGYVARDTIDSGCGTRYWQITGADRKIVFVVRVSFDKKHLFRRVVNDSPLIRHLPKREAIRFSLAKRNFFGTP